MNHTIYRSITVNHVCGNNSVAPDWSQIILRNILLHISNIHSWYSVILNYFLGNISFSVNFDHTIMTDPTSWRLYWTIYLHHRILNSCYIIDLISLSSIGKTFFLFTSFKLKNIFMVYGLESRYIFLDKKFTSCIK